MSETLLKLFCSKNIGNIRDNRIIKTTANLADCSRCAQLEYSGQRSTLAIKSSIVKANKGSLKNVRVIIVVMNYLLNTVRNYLGSTIKPFRLK